MKKLNLIVPVCALAFMMYALPAMSMGYGLYFFGSGGNTTWRGDMGYGVNSVNGGFGFVMDTAVAKDRLFNFRLNVGADILNSAYSRVDVYKFDVLCSFGFGLIRTETIRFWMGPQVGMRINHDSGNVLQRKGIFYEVNIFGMFPSNARYDASTGGIIGGLVMGVNFNIGELLTLALDFGGRANVGTGTVHYNGYFRNYDKHETSWGYEGFVNFAFIFRVNDLYRYQ